MADDKLFWREYIDIYKSLPELWKIKSKENSHRVKKDAAYEVLLEKLKEKDAAANRDAVIKKINSLRSVYRREVRKVMESEKSGAGVDDLYVPTVWTYPLLTSLQEQEDCNESTSTMDEDIEIQIQVASLYSRAFRR